MGDFLIRKQNCLKLIVQQRFCNDCTVYWLSLYLRENAEKIASAVLTFCTKSTAATATATTPMVSSWRWCSWLHSSIVLRLMSSPNRKLGAKDKRPRLPSQFSIMLSVFETVLFCLERPDIVRYKSQFELALENCVHCFDISQHGVTAKLSNPLVQALLTFYIKQNIFKWEIQNTNQFFPFPFWSSSVKYYFANLVRGKGGTPNIHNFFVNLTEYLVS